MFERKVFTFDTRDTTTAIMAGMMHENICNNMQEVGLFIDRTASELSQIASKYFLSRISNDKACTLGIVTTMIRQLVYSELTKITNNISQEKLDKAMALIYREINAGYSKLYPYQMQEFDDCRMTQTSFSSFSIVATKVTDTDGSNSATFSSHAQAGIGSSLQRWPKL